METRIDNLASKFILIKQNKHLFDFVIVYDETKIAFIKHHITDGKVELCINRSLNSLCEDEQNFILAHELAHLEQMLEESFSGGESFSSSKYILHSKDNIECINCFNQKMTYKPVILNLKLNIISSILLGLSIKYKSNILTFISLPLFMFTSMYNLDTIKYILNKRKIEYDADKRAINVLKTNSGAIKFLSRPLYKNYIHFLKSCDWITHPYNIYRLEYVS